MDRIAPNRPQESLTCSARPIAKGRLGRPVEFGYKGQVLDNDDGVVLDHNVEEGNPPDDRNWRPPWPG